MSNNASIDLKANPEGVKVGVGEARKAVERFAEDAEKYFKELGLTTEELEERLKSLKETLTGLAEENEVVTKSSKLLTAENALFATEIAAGLGLLGPFAQALAAVKVGVDLTGAALDSTTKKFELLDKSLIGSKKLIEAAGGDVNKLNAMLASMGTTAEEQGIKVENAWDKVSKAGGKLGKQLFGGTKIQEETSSWFGKLGQSMQQGWDGFWEREAANTVKGIDKLTSLVKKGKDKVAGLLGNLPAWTGMQSDATESRRQEKGEEDQRKAQEAEKLQSLYNEQHKESIAFENEIKKAKEDNRSDEAAAIELLGVTSMEEINRRLKNEESIRASLKETNKLTSEQGKESYARTAKLEEASKAISSEYIRQAEAARDVAKQAEDIEDSFKKQKESIELNNATVEELAEKLEESNAEMRTAAANQAKEDEAKIEREQRILALRAKSDRATNNNDKEDIGKAIVAVATEQEKADKASQDRTQRNGDLRQRMNQKELDAIKIEEQAIDARYSLEETRINEVDKATITRLKAEGISDKDLHGLKLAMMQAEAERALKHADENKDKNQAEADRIKINGQLEKDTIKANADFALSEEMKVFKAKDRQHSVEESKLSSIAQANLQYLKAQGATEQVIHEQKLKMMDAELARALEANKTEEGDLDLIAKHEIDRAREVSDYQLTEDLKRYKLAEISRNVEETKSDAIFKKKMVGLELGGANAKKLHDERMKHIDEEEKREIGKTKSDIEQAAIRAQAEKARIAEKTEFEINEMKRIKDLENDVKAGKISFAEGLKKSGLKPLTRKQAIANLKQRGKDKKEALAGVKAAKQEKANVAVAGRRDKRDVAEANKAEARKQAAAKAAKDKLKQLELVDKNLDRDAKGGDQNKSEDLLKELVAAATTTNRNEDKMIKAMETAGGLA